jgi:hypothetical protein
MTLFTVVLSLGAVLGISECSGGSSPQPTTTPTAQSYTVTVTAKEVATGVQLDQLYTHGAIRQRDSANISAPVHGVSRKLDA